MDGVAAGWALSPRRAAIIVAGGAGARLGAGRPKALVELAGRSLLARAINTVRAAGAELILVAAPAGLALPLAEGVERVDDLAVGEGPLAGIVPALERAAAAELVLLMAVDLPFVTAAHFDQLESALAARPEAAAIVPRTARGLEPLLAVLRPGLVAPPFRAAYAAGERAVFRAFAGLGPGLITFDTPDPAALRGINTPEDFARAVLEAAPPTP